MYEKLKLIFTNRFLILIVLVCLYFSVQHMAPPIQELKIRVINNSEYDFTNVMLYSMTFENLKPKDTSAYKTLIFDPLKDDPLIYCSVDDENYARYLTLPKSSSGRITYSIDSIRNGILHVSTNQKLYK